jgi:hypothetical protein
MNTPIVITECDIGGQTECRTNACGSDCRIHAHPDAAYLHVKSPEKVRDVGQVSCPHTEHTWEGHYTTLQGNPADTPYESILRSKLAITLERLS